MKNKFGSYITLVLSIFVLIVVNVVLNNSEVSRGAVDNMSSQIEELNSKIEERKVQRDGAEASYRTAVSSAGEIDISGEVEDVPVFLWVSEERKEADTAKLLSLAEAYKNYRFTDDTKYIATVNLDVSKLDTKFLPDFTDTVRVGDEYKVAPYAMAVNGAVSYYGYFQYIQGESSRPYGILFDATISESGRVLNAVALSVYPE